MRFPTYYISHGGGPWPWVPQMANGPYARLGASLSDMARDVGATPRAILMLSAHWEEREITVQTNPKPSMFYDYYGFPKHTYEVQYPAPGSPELAARTSRLLEAASIPVREDGLRGFDHGMFAPMAVAWPNADVPVAQLSLKQGLDPAAHLQVGRALAPLRDEGVLIIGSGFSFHNLRRFGPSGYEPSRLFDGWLNDALHRGPAERSRLLEAWEQAPAAREAHQREEHLLPLMMAVGAAQEEKAHRVYHEEDFLGGLHVSSFRFGESARAE